MKNGWSRTALVIAVLSAPPVFAAPQYVVEQILAEERLATQHAVTTAASLLAATTNLVYVPIRFAVTASAAELGGLTSWLTGGNPQAGEGVSGVMGGSVLIEPAMIEGREPFRFGPWQWGGTPPPSSVR